MLSVFPFAIAIVAALLAASLYRSLTRFACDCLREECSCDRQPSRFRRQVQGVSIHEVQNG